MNDTERLDALLTLNINVLPAEDGKWLLIDFDAQPPRTTEHLTGRAAIDAAIAAQRAPAQWGDEPTSYA